MTGDGQSTKNHDDPARSAASRRLLKVTHTQSVTFDQAEVDAVWNSGVLPIPSYVLAGDEDTNPDARAIAVFTALDGSLLELFYSQRDDDMGYEVEDYDPEACPHPLCRERSLLMALAISHTYFAEDTTLLCAWGWSQAFALERAKELYATGTWNLETLEEAMRAILTQSSADGIIRRAL